MTTANAGSRAPAQASVVICAYTDRRWEALLRAVRSVQGQTHPPYETILVIDHNPELLAAARAAIAGVTIIPNAYARGLSGARNTGVAAASGAIVAFLDDDAEADPGWLAALLAAYDQPEVLGVGGYIEPIWEARRPAWFPSEFNWVVGCSYTGLSEQPAPVRNMIGANMSLRREALAQVGGFRIGRVGALAIGQENDETEICIRLAAARPNTTLLYQPAARVRHSVSPDRARIGYFVRRCYSEGLSKSRLVRQVGAERGLSAERTYTLRTLPLGVLRGVAHALGGDLSGLGRAGAIIAGLATTAVGYLSGAIPLPPRALTRA